MKKNELNQFTAVLHPLDGWYTTLKQGEKRQLVVTDTKYKARFTFQAQDEGAICYRLEDLKAQSALLGNARKGPQENDLTVIDQAIYQFELKQVKRLGRTHSTSQFLNGKHWTRELLWLASLNEWRQRAKVYNTLIQIKDNVPKRPNLSRKSNIRVNDQDNQTLLSQESSIRINNRDNQPYVTVIWYRDRGDRSQCHLNEIIAKVVKINRFEKLDST